ncbi:BLOC-1-related complex subunit 8 homolog [Symsagittifera roscoffensis]|uniref:BLOC-1-related complex subunit 8 homolog n=1 Tax=Symsagittifera roscoffensis TaxID=84072 RepID=UPI00307C7F77
MPLTANIHPEIESKCDATCNLMSQTINMIANEPSMGLYRIKEHCRKSAKEMVSAKLLLIQTDKSAQGAYFDADYAVATVQELADARPNIHKAQCEVEKAIELKKLIDSK